MKYLIAVLLLVFSIPLYADTLNWTWTAPTSREPTEAYPQGQPFDMLTEGKGYRAFFNGVAEPDLLVPGDNLLTKTFPPGQVCAEFTTVDLSDRESVRSPPACQDVLAPPGAPSSVTVTIIVQ